MNISEWAAWVQAVGSIAAIVGAFFVARWQFQQSQLAADTARRGEHRASVNASLALLNELIEDVESLAKIAVLPTDQQRLLLEQVDHARWGLRLDLIKQWTVMGGPAPSLRLDWMAVQSTAAKCEEAARGVFSSLDPYVQPTWNLLAINIEMHARRLRAARSSMETTLRLI